MAKSNKASKSNSTADRIDSFRSAALKISPPAHVYLREEDVPFWIDLMETRSPELWTPNDLVQAANLARTQADIEKIQKKLDIEGFTLVNDRGTTVANPANSILETLSRRAIALAKALQVHAIATSGDSRDQRGKNKETARAKQSLDEADDLISKPMH